MIKIISLIIAVIMMLTAKQGIESIDRVNTVLVENARTVQEVRELKTKVHKIKTSKNGENEYRGYVGLLIFPKTGKEISIAGDEADENLYCAARLKNKSRNEKKSVIETYCCFAGDAEIGETVITEDLLGNRKQAIITKVERTDMIKVTIEITQTEDDLSMI